MFLLKVVGLTLSSLYRLNLKQRDFAYKSLWRCLFCRKLPHTPTQSMNISTAYWAMLIGLMTSLLTQHGQARDDGDDNPYLSLFTLLRLQHGQDQGTMGVSLEDSKLILSLYLKSLD